jgi:hypothetical protein
MKVILFISFLLTGVYLNPDLSTKEFDQNSKQMIAPDSKQMIDADQNVTKEYTISGTFTLGPFTYSYTIVVDATICVICNPPYIHINGVNSLSICIQGTHICGYWAQSRIQHDHQGNLEYIETIVDDIAQEDDVEDYVNSATFQQEIKDKLFACE